MAVGTSQSGHIGKFVGSNAGLLQGGLVTVFDQRATIADCMYRESQIFYHVTGRSVSAPGGNDEFDPLLGYLRQGGASFRRYFVILHSQCAVEIQGQYFDWVHGRDWS
jgi:hypothetical protein